MAWVAEGKDARQCVVFVADCKAAMQGMVDHQQLQGGQVGPSGLLHVQVQPPACCHSCT